MQSTYNSFVRQAITLMKEESPISSVRNSTPRIMYYGSDSEESMGIPPIFKQYQQPTLMNITNTRTISPFHISKTITKKKMPPKLSNQKSAHKLACKCQKSQCQKQYCECFAAGRPCSDECSCTNCQNTQCRAIDHKLPFSGCNCKKTGCAKRYCECYFKGVKCTFLCNCVDCCNQEDDEDDDEGDTEEKKVVNKEHRCVGQLSGNFVENSQLAQSLNLGY